MFKAYQGNESYQLDDLTLENQEDVINIYGNLQLHHDQHSLEQAKKLLTLMQDIVQYLEQKTHLPQYQQTIMSRWVDNPFE